MDFKAIQVLSTTVCTLLDEIRWDSFGEPELHRPVVTTEEDCHKLELLVDIMGTLTRIMDTRVAYVTTDGKIVREWIERILEIGRRYRRELETLERLEKQNGT